MEIDGNNQNKKSELKLNFKLKITFTQNQNYTQAFLMCLNINESTSIYLSRKLDFKFN